MYVPKVEKLLPMCDKKQPQGSSVNKSRIQQCDLQVTSLNDIHLALLSLGK